jgi:hypothetical protein
MKHFARWTLTLNLGCFCALTPTVTHGEAVRYGDQAITNGGFDLDADHPDVPSGWTRDVMPAGRAKVAIVKDHGNDVLAIRFKSPDNVYQARLIQPLEVQPDKVYELSFRYKTSLGEGLMADVLLTGTGPLYRSYYLAPSAEWTTRRLYFHVPAHEDAKASIYVQNRSAETVWYDDVSLRPTDIAPDALSRYQPTIQAQSVSTEDQLLLPGGDKTTADFIYQVEADEELRPHLEVTARLFTSDGRSVEAIAGNGRVSIEVDRFTPGNNQLFVFLNDRRDGAQLSFVKLEVERIADSEMQTGGIDLQRPAVFKDRDGKPVFPIGMYGLGITNDAQLAELKAAGFTTVHNYAFEGDPGDRMKRHLTFLDQAQSHGLNVMVGFPRSMAEKKERTGELRPWIESLKDHPANLFYTSDEMHIMRHLPTSQFEAVNRVVHETDPAAQWIIYDIPHKTFAGQVDGVMMVVKDEITAKLARVRLGSDTIVFAVWGQPHYNKAVAPTAEEVRYEVFMPVILGSRGWFYWWYQTLLGNNGEHALLKERLFQNTGLLAEVAPALVSTDPAPAWVDAIRVEGDVLFCHGSLGPVTYVIAGVPLRGEGGRLALSVPGGDRVETMESQPVDPQGVRVGAGEIVILRVVASEPD